MTESDEMNTSAQNIVYLRDLTQVEREAAEWIVRFDSVGAIGENRAALEAWCNQSDQHREALARMSRFWSGMDVLEQLKDYAVADDMADLLKEDHASTWRRVTRRALAGVIAASLVAFGGGAIYKFTFGAGGQAFDAAFETAIGEQETIDLPDGSKVILNTDSAADISFTRSARIVQLARGEAFFDVAPDKSRPFSVETGKGTITAVGTAFSVRVHEGRIEVLVKEGRVALAPRDVPKTPEAPAPAVNASAPLEISAGQSVRFAQRVEAIYLVEHTTLDSKLDWQDGMLSFKGEPLEEVVAELGRYTDTIIEISDPDLRSQKIVAYYRVGEIETMLDALQLMDNIEVERVNDHHVKLYRTK